MDKKKRITVYDTEYWIKRGYTEEESVKKIYQSKKENCCWNKEFWIVKKGYTEEQAIEKVSEKQKINSERRDKSTYINLYLIDTWIKRGYTEEETIEKINNLKRNNNIYETLPKESVDKIIQKRKDTFNLKTKEEKLLINKSKGRTKKELTEKYGEEYVINMSEKRGLGRTKKGTFRRYSKTSKGFFDELNEFVNNELLYAEKEVWIRHNKNNGYFVDLLIKDTNKIIEYNGDFYHANPKIYESNSIINVAKTKIYTASEIWEKDRLRIKSLNELGYDVLIIWESDIKKNKINEINRCIDFIKNK